MRTIKLSPLWYRTETDLSYQERTEAPPNNKYLDSSVKQKR